MSYYDFARYGSFGISWVLATSIYLYLGYMGGLWLDARVGSEPLFMVLGLLFAMCLSLVSLMVQVTKLIKELERNNAQNKGQRHAHHHDRPASEPQGEQGVNHSEVEQRE